MTDFVDFYKGVLCSEYEDNDRVVFDFGNEKAIKKYGIIMNIHNKDDRELDTLKNMCLGSFRMTIDNDVKENGSICIGDISTSTGKCGTTIFLHIVEKESSL